MNEDINHPSGKLSPAGSSDGDGDANILWRRVFDALLDPVVILSADGTILQANPAAVSFLEKPLDKILGQKCYQLFHQAEDHIEGCPLARLAQTQRRETMEMPLGDRHFLVVVDPVFLPSGKMAQIVHMVRDITSLKQSQRRLAEQENLLQIAARTVGLGGWSVNAADMRLEWSEEVARIHEVGLGYVPTVENSFRFYAPEWRDRIREVFTRCLEEGVPYDEEMEIITARGRRVWVRTCGMAVRDETGRIVMVQGSFQDISQQKNAEEERKKLHAQLMMAQKIESVGRLASGIAHDFNNLLSVVLGYTNFALEDAPEGSWREDLLEIQKAAERAAKLTRQLLAFSRKQVLSMQVLPLADIVSGMENLLRRLLGEDIEIVMDLHPETGLVRVDPGQMEQVVMNLAVNARDAMPGGGKLVFQTRPAVIDEAYADTHGSLEPGVNAMLAVADTGCGMDPEIMDRIFDPFFTTKPREQGTGLGLSIVHGTVSQCGGRIWVYSEKGKGTTFKLYFPIAEATHESPVPEPPTAVSRGRETILLVEDEPAVRSLAVRMLSRAGYEVVGAAGHEDALELAQRLPQIDLLITDVVMPRTSGIKLAETLRRQRPQLKVVFISGYPETLGRIPSDSPFTGFLGKPFSFAELTRKVRDLLDAQ